MPEKKAVRSAPTKRESITVGKFFARHRKELGLRLVGEDCGYDREIQEPTINRPGLALAGYFSYFAFKRIQVIGKAERSYLRSLDLEDKAKRFLDFVKRDIPCIIISRGETLSDRLLEIANAHGISVFRTSMVTMNFINAATIQMEWDFAPTQNVHGCMVDSMGIGIFIRGDSGMGKSECVLSLLRRGASLVADDVVIFRNIEGREIIGEAKELGKSHMEVRGLGIINVGAIFGIGSIRLEKRLDLVVTLKREDDINQLERFGAEQREFSLLGLKIPEVELPVAPGRDLAQMIEVAALDQKLRSFGYNTAVEFNKKLLKIMRDRRIN
ncbi:MAG: HPr kinase/phosphorylase [Verrucomicrobiales bacterium]|jgi:HPr kinase/phosphorylase